MSFWLIPSFRLFILSTKYELKSMSYNSLTTKLRLILMILTKHVTGGRFDQTGPLACLSPFPVKCG